MVEILMMILLQRYDMYFISFVVLLVIAEDIVINTSLKISLVSTIGIYIISCVIFYFRYSNDVSSMIMHMLFLIPVYFIEFIIFYLINYLLKQNKIINENLKNITVQNIEKENLNRNLKEAYSKVENITTLRERNRIAAEIHDTVGHTLTTVLVELEASKRLMNKDKDKALEKLNIAQEQVRKGLNSIRSSVRIIEKGDNILDFSDSIEALVENEEKHSDVVIKTYIDKNIKICKKAQEVIFSALIEGLTNGIRHGKSTAFLFRLYEKEDRLYFSLQDNGKGSGVISPGFGLRAMRNRVEELKGNLDITSVEGEGFNLDIWLPLNEIGGSK